MKKNKTSLGISSVSAYEATKKQQIDQEVETMQKKSRQSDYELVIRKNQLLTKQLEMTKQSKKCMQKQLESYRKIVFKNSDIHEILQMQHEKIFQLQTKLQVLQNKYEKLLAVNGSEHQTEYAVKCKEMEQIIKKNQVDHQKQVSLLKAKMMRINASEIVENRSGSNNLNSLNYSGYMSMQGTNNNVVTPIKNSRKLV